jgi:aspartyl-tRNA(Asn)/glutamyl-tRNA(Gln) amidotransferase subunit A
LSLIIRGVNRREAIAALLAGPILGIRAVAQPSDLTGLTVAQAAEQLAKREITPLQLADAYLSRIAKLNPDLNAFVTVTRDLARRAARELPEPRGGSPVLGLPLYGIPIAHKDLFETRGVRTTAGSLLFEEYIPDNNAAIVQQLERAGAVLLGKTNTHELGGGVTTINPFFGTTRNPVDRTRIPGGSSGGSAAAVAARLCLAATGSDTGGSVRIPAAFCGCVGFKPTFGRISTRGLIAASPSFDHVGFLTRTVEDAQILLSVFPASGAVPASSAVPAKSTVPAEIKLGVPRNFFFSDLERAVERAVKDALAKVSAQVVTIDFPIDAKTMSVVFDPVFLFELWHRFGADWRTNPGSFSKEFSGVFSIERSSVAEYEAGLAALKDYQASVDKLFDSVDVIVTPTVPITAPLITDRIDGMKILRNTWPFNAAGTPAISIPLTLAPEAPISPKLEERRRTPMPIGLQFVARRGEDDKLLQIARRFEEV